MTKLLVIGSGGHCVSVVRSALSQYEIVGIIDNNPKNDDVLGIKIIGNDQDLPLLWDQGIKHAFVAIGDNLLRRKLNENLKRIGYILVNIIDGSARICHNAKLGQGIFAGQGAIINGNTEIGDGSIINTGAIIEHGCVVGHYTHCGPGSVLCGNVSIGNDCHIGANAVIIQNLAVADNIIVGAGGVVIKPLSQSGTYVGNPVRLVAKKGIN